MLDLGCGAGRLAVYVAEHGAESVRAVDVSERMLALARPHPRLTYRRVSLEDLDLAPDSFEVAVSSLTFHYSHSRCSTAGRPRWRSSIGSLMVLKPSFGP